MAKTAAKRPAAKAPVAAKRGGGMKPALLAAGVAIYWLVEQQGLTGEPDAPAWGYAATIGVRFLMDFVGALVLVSALQLLLVLGRLAIVYGRGLWLQAGNR